MEFRVKIDDKHSVVLKADRAHIENGALMFSTKNEQGLHVVTGCFKKFDHFFLVSD